jgi:hypothetical protein
MVILELKGSSFPKAGARVGDPRLGRRGTATPSDGGRDKRSVTARSAEDRRDRYTAAESRTWSLGASASVPASAIPDQRTPNV